MSEPLLQVEGLRKLFAIGRGGFRRGAPLQVHAVDGVSFTVAAGACPRYAGRIIRAIDPQAKTPVWMLERLRRGGIRGIHPVVDVTNYVTLELGQPMHGFDLGRLHDTGIEVRHARSGETLTLLDGNVLALDAGAPVAGAAAARQPAAGGPEPVETGGGRVVPSLASLNIRLAGTIICGIRVITSDECHVC